MSHLPHTIQATVTAITDTDVSVTLENGSLSTLPRHLFSQDARVGDTIHLAVFSSEDTKIEHERLAKAVLAELLQ